MTETSNHSSSPGPITPDTVVGRLKDDMAALFSECLHGFQAFSELAELAEDMRILSLNAELAAGRAGEHGAAVRALTQYTRELVVRLSAIETNMLSLKSKTYAAIAMALRFLHQLRYIDLALGRLQRRESNGDNGASAIRIVSECRQKRLVILLDDVQDMVGSVNGLSAEADTVSDVMSQAASIATNIAIEAAAAGVHEAEFKQVAVTMSGYVEQLHNMVDNAGGAIRDAVALGCTLGDRARENIDRHRI